MGFATAVQKPAPLPLILLARVDAGDLAAVQEAAYEGAEGVLIGVGPATDDEFLKAVQEASSRIMWGGSINLGGRTEVERLLAAGSDLVLLHNPALRADALTPEIDKLIEVEGEWPDGQLRAVEALGVAGAVYRLGAGDFLTIQQLLDVQRIALLVRKPLIVALPPGVDHDAVGALRDAGVAGILVAAAKVSDFRNALKALPAVKKPQGRPDALVPTVPSPRHDHDDDDGEDRGDGPPTLG
jgi:hypothetical protein